MELVNSSANTENSEDLLDEILCEDSETPLQREQTAFDAALKRYSESVVLFGAGGLGRNVLAGLRSVGIEPIGFTDNNPSLWGKTVDGLSVFSPEEAAAKWKHQAAFIVTVWRHGSTDRMGDRVKQFQQLGCQTVVPFIFLYWKYPEVFLPHYMIDLPSHLIKQKAEIRAAFSLFVDDLSRREFLSQIKFRYWGDFNQLTGPIIHETYFPNDLAHTIFSKTFIDCGAYVGDTVKAFLELYDPNFSNIYAIEPDPINFSQLEAYISSLPKSQREKIIAYRLAVGNANEKVRFNAQGMASSSIGNGEQFVDCVRLDNLLTNIRPTFIKMDVEGAEPEALLGVKKLIENNHPMLAISAYHQQNHLWQIPLLIHSISDRYQFHLRAHQRDGFDLVCYAVPK